MTSTPRAVTLARELDTKDDEDPNLILIIEAGCDTTEATAMALEHNKDRYIPPEADSDEESEPESRETTPSPKPEIKRTHQLRLTFNKPPKNKGRGFSFGTEGNRCDVLLNTKRGGGQISKVHFYITFDEKGRLLLIDESTCGTAVSYGGWGQELTRHHFKWILLSQNQIRIHLPMNFTLDVVQPKHFFCKKEYQANITSFLNDARDAVLALGGLYVQSSRTSKFPTGSHSPGQQAIYLPRKHLGEGGYGTVCLVTHLSTAKFYAAKELIRGSGLSKEAKLMRDISHKHIVQFVDFTHDPTTQLIMEYLPLGSLHDQHKIDPITLTETRKLLLQGLDALRYLHSLSSPITHRDIKPANILVQGRGANFHIKLSDFGLSKDTPFLKTGCGTLGYTPPEVYRVAKERKMEKDQRKLSTLIYDNKVDVWALGVVVLQYTDDLPYDALALYEQIADAVKDLRRRRPDDPFTVLLDKMLRKSPLTRPSSEDCFQEALKIGYPSDEDTSGSVTPTRHDFEASNEMLASFKVPTQILAGDDRVLGSKRDPSPTRSSGHQNKRPRINHPYYHTVMGMLSDLRLHGALIDNGGNDEYTATSIELICDEFSRQKITHIKVDSVGSHGVTIKAYRANKSGEFVLGHFTSSKPTNSMDLAYELKIQNSEKGSNRASGLSEAASEYSAHYEHRLLNNSYGRLSSGTIKPPPRI